MKNDPKADLPENDGKFTVDPTNPPPRKPTATDATIFKFPSDDEMQNATFGDGPTEDAPTEEAPAAEAAPVAQVQAKVSEGNRVPLVQTPVHSESLEAIHDEVVARHEDSKATP